MTRDCLYSACHRMCHTLCQQTLQAEVCSDCGASCSNMPVYNEVSGGCGDHSQLRGPLPETDKTKFCHPSCSIGGLRQDQYHMCRYVMTQKLKLKLTQDIAEQQMAKCCPDLTLIDRRSATGDIMLQQVSDACTHCLHQIRTCRRTVGSEMVSGSASPPLMAEAAWKGVCPSTCISSIPSSWSPCSTPAV